MIEQVRYITKDDLQRKDVLVRTKGVNWELESVYPIVRHFLLDDGPVRCLVVAKLSGDGQNLVVVEMPLLVFNALGTVPTHDSVAHVPRKDMRR
jgi:hypothetical protein